VTPTRVPGAHARVRADQELLLRAALLSDRRAIEAWGQWRDRVEFDAVDRDSTRLLPLLWHNLLSLGLRDPLMGRLKGIYRHSWLANQVLFRDLREALGILTRVGIDALVLKGAALAHAYYPNPGMRAMDDIDVLVRPADIAAALSALQDHGWAPTLARPERLLVVMHALAMRKARGRDLDLHGHLFAGSMRADVDAERWARAVVIEHPHATWRALDPTDQLLHVLVHGVEADPPTVQWIADATMILRGAGDGIDWTRLVTDADREGRGLAVAAARRELHGVLGLPADGPRTRLSSGVRHTISERLEHRVAAAPRAPFIGVMLKRYVAYRRWRRYANRPTRFGFGRYLQIVWQVDRTSQLPAELVRRGIRRAVEDAAELRSGTASNSARS
jgi:hypothetical protein